MTCDTRGLVNFDSKFQVPSSSGFGVNKLGRFGGKGSLKQNPVISYVFFFSVTRTKINTLKKKKIELYGQHASDSALKKIFTHLWKKSLKFKQNLHARIF